MAGDAGDLRATLSLENKQFLDAMKQVSDSVTEGTETIAGKFDSIAGFAEKVGGALSAIGIAGGLEKLGEMALDAVNKIDKLHAAFVALNGPTEETEKLFEDLRDVAEHSTFDFKETLGPAAKQMLQLGASVETVEQSIKALADETAALKLSPENITNVTRIFATMSDQIVASERNFKALRAEGISASDALAQKLGVSVPEAMEKVKAGLISTKTVIEAVNESLENKFGGAAEKALGTWAGQLDQLHKASDEVLEAIGRSLKTALNDLAPVLAKIVEGVKAVADWMKNLPDPVKNAVIAFGLIAAAATSVAAAFPVILPALEAVGAAFLGWPAVIAVVVGALVALGSWIHENWGAITAVVSQAWDGLKEDWTAVWTAVSAAVTEVWEGIRKWLPWWGWTADLLMAIWDKLPAVWSAVWGQIKGFLVDVWNGIKLLAAGIMAPITATIDGLKTLLTTFGPGAEKLRTLGDTWAAETKKSQDAKTATDALAESRKKEQEAASAETKAAKAHQDELNNYAMVAKALGIQAQGDLDKRVSNMKEYEASLQKLVAAGQGGVNAERDLQAAHQAVLKAEQDAAAGSKNLVEANKAAAEAAKKRAEEEKKNSEAIKKAYDELKQIAPDLATQFSAAMGGISDATVKTGEAVETVRKKMGAGFAAQVQAALDLQTAYKTLGVTTTESLAYAAGKADEAFAKVSAAFAKGKASQADYTAALQGVYAAHQKLADSLNKDLKDAYDKGLISAQEYYQGVLDRAVKNAADLKASGTATGAAILAADKQVADARAALAKQNTSDIATAYHALGEKTIAELAKTAGEWQKYSEVVAKTSGEGTSQAIQAQIKALQAARDVFIAAGQDTSKLDAQIQALTKTLAAQLPAVQRLEAAFKTLGVTSTAALEKAARDAADALAEVEKQAAAGKATDADVYAAQKKVTDEFQRMADVMNAELKDAYERGDITAAQYAAGIVANAELMEAKYKELYSQGKASLDQLAAAHQVVINAQKNVEKNLDGLTQALHSVGAKTEQEYKDQAAAALENYKKIAAAAGSNSEAALKAWKDYLETLKKSHDTWGTEWTAADQKALEQTNNALDKFGKKGQKTFDDFWKSVRSGAETFISDIGNLLIFGKGSSAAQNKELDKQEADLQKSLADRLKQWEQYQTDAAKTQADATAKYQQDLAANEQDLADSLDKAAKDYADYSDSVQQNIDDIIQKHQDATEQGVADAADALQKQQDAYSQYADDVAQNIDDIHDKYSKDLRDEEDSLEKSLRDRSEKYQDFVDQANTSLQRIGEDTATNIKDETEDTKRNIAQRQTDYNRYAEDTAKKIADLRLKNKGQNSAEEDDLRLSLTRKKEDLDEYISEQNQKLDRYVRDQNTRLERETADNKTALDQQTRDYNEFTADAIAQHDTKVSDLQEAEAKEVQAQQDALAQKKKDLDQFTADTAAKIQEIQDTNAAEQDAEVQKQQEALAQKKLDYEAAVEGIKSKSEEQKTKINADYEATTTKQLEELNKQRADYDAFVQDIVGPGGKMEQLKAQHKTIWNDIGALGTKALEDIGGAMLKLASKEIMGDLMDKLAGMKGILGDIGTSMGGVADKISGVTPGGPGAPSVPGAPGAPSVPGVPGGGDSSGGGLGSFLSGGLFGNLLSAGTLVSSVIGNFQNARQENTLNAIEQNTRYAMIGQSLGVIPNIEKFLPRVAEMRDLFFDVGQGLWQNTADWIGDIRTWVYNMEPFVVNTSRQLDTVVYRLNDIIGQLSDIATAIANEGERSITVNVSATGVTPDTAKSLGGQLATSLSQQLVGATLR